MLTNRQQRDACKLYKAIAEVFDKRIDLSDKQKHDLINDCYRAAQWASEQRQQEIQQEQMKNVSLGRRIA